MKEKFFLQFVCFFWVRSNFSFFGADEVILFFFFCLFFRFFYLKKNEKKKERFFFFLSFFKEQNVFKNKLMKSTGPSSTGIILRFLFFVFGQPAKRIKYWWDFFKSFKIFNMYICIYIYIYIYIHIYIYIYIYIPLNFLFFFECPIFFPLLALSLNSRRINVRFLYILNYLRKR